MTGVDTTHLLNPSTGTVHIEQYPVTDFNEDYSLCAYGPYEHTTLPVTCKACLCSHKASMKRKYDRLVKSGLIPAHEKSRES